MKDTDQLSEQEAAQRREKALKIMLHTPPKQHEEMKKPRHNVKPKTRAKTRKA